MEFPKEFEEFQFLESLEVQEDYSAWAMWKRGLVSNFSTFYLWMNALFRMFPNLIQT